MTPEPEAGRVSTKETASLPEPRLKPGDIVAGRFVVVRFVARGGMGLVYRARQVSLNRIVALKMISTGDLASRSAVERFKTEAETAARLEHPNIVPIYEIGRHQGKDYFSMRFLEGGTLTQMMACERFSPRRAAELCPVPRSSVHRLEAAGFLGSRRLLRRR